MGLTFLDFFAGIGGFRLGMQQAGHTSVGWVEWDKFARKSFEAIHNPEGEWTAHDIRSVDYRDMPRADVWTFGFPCQDISVAGKGKGFSGDRSSLFFSVTRLLRQTKEWDTERLPSYLFIENVKNFLSVNDGWDFLAAQIELDEIGYECEWDVLNSKEYVPQNRERVFIIGHLRGRGTRKVFPLSGASAEVNCQLVGMLDIKGKDQIRRVYSPDGIAPTLTTMQGGNQEPKIILQKTHGCTTTINYGQTGTLQAARLDKIPCVVEEHRAVLTPDREEKRQNGRRFKEPGEPMFTLTAQDKHGVAIKKIGHLSSDSGQTGAVYGTDGIAPTQLKQHGNAVTKIMDDWRIRKLTPRECFRLQGFPDWAFDRAAAVNSDSQLYKQAGNSVTVDVIFAIASQFEIAT